MTIGEGFVIFGRAGGGVKYEVTGLLSFALGRVDKGNSIVIQWSLQSHSLSLSRHLWNDGVLE